MVEIEDLLIGLPKADRPGLVSRTVLRFALYVVDLPASKNHHDSQAFGLLDHSLEVARAAVGELVRPGFRVSEDPAANYREQPIWAYAGFVLGLFHDAGKMLDLEVHAKEGGEAWNPLTEPLAAFLRRSGKRSSKPDLTWKKGRGLNAHAWKGQALVPLILPPRATALLGSRLGHLMEVFSRSYVTDRKEWTPGPAGRVVDTVRRFDHHLAKGETGVEEEAIAPGKAEVASPVLEVVVTAQSNAISPEGPDPAGQTMLGEERPGPESAEAQPQAGKIPVISSPTTSDRPEEGEAEDEAGAKEETEPPFPRKPVLPNRKIEFELEPKRLIQTIKDAVRAVNVRCNGAHSEAFICQEHIWFLYPQALVTILRGVGVHWTTGVAERVLATLLKAPQLEPQNPRSALVYALLLPRGKDPVPFVRFRTEGFLPDDVLAPFGLWPHEIKVVDAAMPRQVPNAGWATAKLGRV